MKRVFWAVTLIAVGFLGLQGQTPSGSGDMGGEPSAAGGNGSSIQRAAQDVPVSAKVGGARNAVTITQLSSVTTASPAQSFALYGNYAYVCDVGEITVVNISNPAALQIGATVTHTQLQNSFNSQCAVTRDTLAVFEDTNNSQLAGAPSFLAFHLTNAASPQIIGATPINRRFFGSPVYLGNYAYVPTRLFSFFGPTWESQHGDLLSYDLTNFAAPVLADYLEEPQTHVQGGGPTIVLGATHADGTLLYLGGSTSTLGFGARFGWGNLGMGRVQVVDTANPNDLKLVGQLTLPGTKHFNAPIIQGTVAVGIGNNGGFDGSSPPDGSGNIVVATFDVSDRRAPAISSITTTTYKVGLGGGATRIGNLVFAFSGVTDANDNPVLLIVDASNPNVPIIESIPTTHPFTKLEAQGTVLYASRGASGFATYSIPGIDNTPTGVCPVFMDTILVLDRGAALPSQAFADAKAAMKSFVDSIHLPSDRAGVASFTTSATLDQLLTSTPADVKTAIDGIIPGGVSYIGSGIAAAHTELVNSPRSNPAAVPVMIVLSDGADLGAPNTSATLAAAQAAKAAGVRIISLQYGSVPNALMQSIASSPGDFRLIGQ